MNNIVKIICGLLCFVVMSCRAPEGGITPIGAIPELQLKSLTNNLPGKAICHVDLEHNNPLNVKDYYFEAVPENNIPEMLLFDYVVLGHVYLEKDDRDVVQLRLTPQLQYILDNNKTYIKPLREKGIKILIEIRSGHYSDNEPGIGLGMGTMDMASIRLFVMNLVALIERYELDGYEFNDIGGGQNAYSPYTRNLKQFQKNEPLYPESMFLDENDEPFDDKEVERILWREGGSFFALLIYRTFESLKVTKNATGDYHVINRTDPDYQDMETVERTILVRDSGHGSQLVADIRNAYMPDGYSGTNASVTLNLEYIVHTKPHDDSEPHPYLYSELGAEKDQNIGTNADDKYIPITVDLSDRLENPADIRALMRWVPGTADSPKKYNAVYFTNLPSISEADAESGEQDTLITYLDYITRALFGRRVSVRENGGNYKKTW